MAKVVSRIWPTLGKTTIVYFGLFNWGLTNRKEAYTVWCPQSRSWCSVLWADFKSSGLYPGGINSYLGHGIRTPEFYFDVQHLVQSMECNTEQKCNVSAKSMFKLVTYVLPVQNWGICYCSDHTLDSEPQIPMSRLFCCYITWRDFFFSQSHWRKMQE